MLDVTMSTVVQIVVMICGVGATIAALRVNVKFLKAEFAALKIETKADIGTVQLELKKIADILVAQADMRGEIKVLSTRFEASDRNLNSRIDAVEQDVRDIHHTCALGHRKPRA